jgi:hypothetical protein
MALMATWEITITCRDAWRLRYSEAAAAPRPDERLFLVFHLDHKKSQSCMTCVGYFHATAQACSKHKHPWLVPPAACGSRSASPISLRLTYKQTWADAGGGRASPFAKFKPNEVRLGPNVMERKLQT